MKNDFKIGIFFTALGQYSNMLIQFLITVVLSRLLTPEDFGIIAIVQVFLLLFQVIATAGMGPAIIQNKTLKSSDYGILFNYSAIFSIFLGVVFSLFGNVVSYIYQNNAYKSLFLWMSVVVVAECLNTVPNAILNKEKKFVALNIRFLIANIFGAIAGIIAAICGLGVYALIISVAIPAIVTLICNFFLVRIKWTISFKKEPFLSVWQFAKNQFASTLLNFFSRNLDNILIGKFFGPQVLGYYSKGYQLTVLPSMVIGGIISPVLQPILSEYEQDIEVIRETYLKLIHFIAILAFPVSIFMSLNADKIIYFLFGAGWQGAVMPLRILSLSIWAQVLSTIHGYIIQSRNQPTLLFRTGMIMTGITVVSIVIGVLTRDLTLLASLVAAAYSINFFISNTIVMKYSLESNLLSLLKVIQKPFYLGCFIAVLLTAINPLINFDSHFLSLLVRGCFWLVIICIYLVLAGELKEIKAFLKK